MSDVVLEPIFITLSVVCLLNLQVYTLEEMILIADLCKKHDVIVISDEVYEWLVYPPNKHFKIGLC